jgi:sugar transferase (PEP-CTERM/EpsH1 system associated)
VCLTEAGPFLGRISSDVAVVELRRRPGQDMMLHGRLWRALKELHPAVVHTRNLAALEGQIPAALLPGVRRVHGEHGRDVFDLHGTNRKYNFLRRAIRPLVQRYTSVSRDLESWLVDTVGVAPERICQIYNGVDRAQFHPRRGERPDLAPPGFLPENAIVVGAVGRLAAVKDQRALLGAIAILSEKPEWASRVRLILVGDGELRVALECEAARLGIAERTWFAGDRDDVAALMRAFDLFVLPSLGEGISNTLLEAMATGLPAVATRVGGNPELVDDGITGALVPPGDPQALAMAMLPFLEDAKLRDRCGMAARAEVERRFDWERCVDQYLALYDELLGRDSDSVLRSVNGRGPEVD